MNKLHLKSWPRFPLERWLRRWIVLALALMALVPAYFALGAFQAPATAAVQVPVWGWVHWGEWDFSVYLQPNTVYGTRELGPGRTYYDILVEDIEARFSYTFATDVPARIEGWYEVIASLSVGELPGERVLLVPRTEFEGEGSSASVGLAVEVDREAFRRRVREILAETGVQTRANATVTYVARVEATATTEAGTTRQTLEPTLVVPLIQEAFTISGERSMRQDGVVRRPQERRDPGVAARRRVLAIFTGVAVLLPLVFALLTTPQSTYQSPLDREACRLRRKYRRRIAQAGPGDSRLPGGEVVPVASMEDLARVSEELLKPIIYASLDGRNGGHLFYIVDGATRYEYELVRGN